MRIVSASSRRRDEPSGASVAAILGRALMTTWLLYAGGALLAAYLLVVLAFVVAGRRTDARALAGFVPDCVILFSRLLRDPRVPRRSKILVAALIPYLALPVDLIPDVIPVAGQADDAVLVALVLRILVKRTDAAVLRELWPGPDRSLLVVFRLAGVRVAAP
jgi:uncharacterized membrane protein YkvA (DUF1232 family)